MRPRLTEVLRTKVVRLWQEMTKPPMWVNMAAAVLIGVGVCLVAGLLVSIYQAVEVKTVWELTQGVVVWLLGMFAVGWAFLLAGALVVGLIQWVANVEQTAKEQKLQADLERAHAAAQDAKAAKDCVEDEAGDQRRWPGPYAQRSDADIVDELGGF